MMKYFNYILFSLLISFAHTDYFNVEVEETGVSSLHILMNSITGLEIGDEIGFFDANGITNYNDCSNDIGMILVASSIWVGSQNNITSIGSVDLCPFGGVQLAGYVESNAVIIRVYRPSTDLEYETQITFGLGNGMYGEIIQTITEIVIENSVISGCMDLSACNYDPNATVDNGNCLEEDCTGECGGIAVVDECGICEGSGPEDNFDCDGNCLVELDCNGDCGGTAFEDCLGECEGSANIGCDGICNSGLTTDCNGDCGGTAVVDCTLMFCCGGETGINCTELDCNEDCNGSAIIDDCDICSGGETNHIENSDMDCTGVCFGNNILDECGVCSGDGYPCLDGESEIYISLGPHEGGDVLVSIDYSNASNEICITDPIFSNDSGTSLNTEISDCIYGVSTLGTLDIYFSSISEIGGFQFQITGLNILSAYGGAAGDSGFMISSGNTIVLGFSLTGSTIGENSENYGCTDSTACNYESNATTDDGSCIFPEEGTCNCDGNIEDCLGECGGNAEVDDCGVCNGNNEDMDCLGLCNGTAEYDECGICEGAGPTIECDDGTFVCDEESCIAENCYDTECGYYLLIGLSCEYAMDYGADCSICFEQGYCDDTGDDGGGDGNCTDGYVDDCSGDGDCCSESWIGDGYADCEDQPYGCDLTCYDNDGGDCGDPEPMGELSFGEIDSVNQTVEILMDCQYPVSAFDIEVSGIVVNSAFGGDAGEFNFEVTTTDSTVIGESTGDDSVIPEHNGLLTILEYSEVADSLICFEYSNITTYIGIEYEAILGDCISSPLSSGEVTVEIPLHYGANLISLYALPEDSYIGNVMSSLEGNITGVIGEGVAANVLPNGSWVGGLVEIDETSGYWVKVVNDDTLTLENAIPLDVDLTYYLHSGTNLISFPFNGSINISEAIPDEVEGYFTGIIGEGVAANVLPNGSWVGGLTNFQGGDGYWAKINSDINFSFDIDGAAERTAEVIFQQINNNTIYEYVQSTRQAFYFIKDIIINEVPIDDDDWVLVYNDNILVGARQWTGEYTDIPAMGYDGTAGTEGYLLDGDTPKIKVIKQSGEQYDMSHIPEWGNNTLYTLNELNNIVIPQDLTITNIFPNPFNPITTIEFGLSEDSDISISIYNINGQLIEQLIDKFYTAGLHHINWDATQHASGVYFVKVNNNVNISTKKIILMK